LPRYAVPVFIRVVGAEVGGMASHNNKQEKVALRTEGVDPGLRGSRVGAGRGDQVFWLKPGVEGYVRFEEDDWKNLIGGRARL